MLRRSSILYFIYDIVLVPGTGSGTDKAYPVFTGCGVIGKVSSSVRSPVFDKDTIMDYVVEI